MRSVGVQCVARKELVYTLLIRLFLIDPLIEYLEKYSHCCDCRKTKRINNNNNIL